MKHIISLLLLIVLMVPLVAKAEETAFVRVMKTKTIHCGYMIAPPYLIKDPNTGKMSGINYEMVEAVGKNLGLKIKWTTEIGAGDVAAALSANKFDVMCQTMWPSSARYSGMTFTNRPQFYSAVYAAVRYDDNRFDGDVSKANHKDIRVTAIEGDFGIDLAHEKLPNATLVPLSTASGLGEYIMQLTTKKADILFMDKGTINDFSRLNPGQVRMVKDIPPVRIYGEHLTVKSGEYQLRDMLDMTTLQLVNDGIFAEIVKRYAKEYDTDMYPSQKDIAQ